ncbi:ABC transporter permease [Spirosoma sp. KNUC1025]|uniref:ABC transporter permease n=1 Tax=Spirosoma sp. KNUC1025 TaxID=2894082 RepID=UPI00386617E7|nr:ABC transporter permease [Spirosoma sp. KNUC1025]
MNSVKPNNSNRANKQPPRWAERLLAWLHPAETLEEVQGDLDELYAYWYQRAGEPQASLRYVLNVLSVLPPFVLRRRTQKAQYPKPSSFHPSMLRNYLKIAFRTLWRSKGYAAVNVVGLSVAFCVCTFLFEMIYRQLTFDSFHQDGDRIFQIYLFKNEPAKAERSGGMPMPLTPTLKTAYPEIQAATRILPEGSLIEYKGKYLDKSVNFVDADFLNVFSFQMLKGNRNLALRDFSSLVISEKTAEAIFGNEDPIGKAVLLGNKGNQKQYIVSGVLADAPDNSSIRYDMVARIENTSTYQNAKDQWDAFSHKAYVKVAPNVDQASLENRLKPFAQTYFSDDLEKLKKKGAKPDERGDLVAVRLQKLANVHFDREITSSGAPIAVVYALLGIAFFILAIACINFINLSIARSFTRAREVGVRKSLGALKKQLFVQIWSESALICLVGFLVGSLMAFLLVPAFNAQFNAKINLNSLLRPGVIGGIIGMFLLVTLVAGGYPSWQMAKFNAVEVLKGKITMKRPGFLRNSLIVTQFTISCLLTCCTIFAIQQVGYLRSRPLGFEKEQVISIPVGNKYSGRQLLQRLRNKLTSDPTVLAISGSNVNLGRGKDGSTSRSMLGFTYKEKEISTDWLLVDYDYLKTLNIKLLAGREFNPAYPADSLDRVVITESMAKQIGEKNPVGKFFQTDTAGTKYQIIGLVPDYHLYSLQQEKKPITMHLSNSEAIDYIFVRVTPQSLNTSMEKLKGIWSEIAPGAEFTGSFLDENIDAWYRNEDSMAQVFSFASGIAILLSCLGLFAVALMAIEQRTKEIGVRKVLGASIPGIVLLLSRDFVKLVLIALAIATPLTWFLMSQWLAEYPYRIDISIWVFALVGVAAILIAVATVSFHSIKAALVNPVKSLRSE